MIRSNYKEPKLDINKERNVRSLFYIRAKYSFAIVVKEDMKERTKEFIFFDRAKLTNKWIKEIFSPHFDIHTYPFQNRFIVSDKEKNQHIVLNVYFFNYSYVAYDFLTGMIAINTLNQSIESLNEWVNESLNVDPDKLREKVKALLDMIDSYPSNYKLVK